MEENYRRVLAKARITGEAHDYRHLDGWRSCKRPTIIDLYVQGKVTATQAVACGARPKDHLEALEAGGVKLEALIEAGVDLRKLDTVRKQLLARMGHKVMSEKDTTTLASAQAARDANERTKAMPPVMCMIKKGEQTVQVRPKNKPLTLQEVQVAAAMLEHEARQKLKAKMERLKAENARMDKVDTLTPEQKAEIAARFAAKGKPILK